jgi:hypothetical protein
MIIITITERLQKYTDLKRRANKDMATKCSLYSTISIIHKGYYPPIKLDDSFKLLSLRPGLYILMQKAVILNTCDIGRKFLAEQ